jgi:hypothetical protein
METATSADASCIRAVMLCSPGSSAASTRAPVPSAPAREDSQAISS